MSAQFEYLNLSIKKTGTKNKLEISIKDDHGNIKASNTCEYHIDSSMLATLENKLGKNVKETASQIKAFGKGLFNSIFDGEILGFYKSLKDKKKDIRLKLFFSEDHPELLRIPWEFMHDGENYLSAYPGLTISRVLDGVSVEKKDPIEGKIRILVVVSSPLDIQDRGRLQVEKEQLLIMQALDRAYSENKIDIEFLDEASLKNIQAKLDEEEFHILHYTGHGVYSEKEHRGYLLLEDDSGKSRAVDNETVANLLAGYKSLRLVVLSGCQTAKTSGREALSDLATPLLLKNIPSVVAMQYSVTDTSAMALAKKLYSEIANGTALDMALTRARKQLLLDDGFGQVEFGTPVLFSNDLDCLEVKAQQVKPQAGGFLFQKPIAIKPNIALGIIEQLGSQFIGRRKELRRVKDDFLQGKRVVVLHGIGGIGKTVTATKIVEKLKDNYSGIYAFDCREELSSEKILIRLNEFFKANGIDALDQAVAAQISIDAKLNYLAQVLSQIKLLLIFDNFESQLTMDEDAKEIKNPDLKKGLKTLVSQCKDGTRFLFTCRYTFNLTDGRLTSLIDEINLGEMSRPEAIMIMNRFPDIAREDFETKLEIYDKIGGHPYTINIFGVHAGRTSTRDVLLSIEGVNKEMVRRTLIDKSYEKLSNSAKKLLNSAAVLKKSIPYQGLEWLIKENNKTPVITGDIEELTHWGLIVKIEEEDETYFIVHTLVKDFIKDKTDDAQWKKWQIRAAKYYEDLANKTRIVWNILEAYDLYFEAQEYDKAGNIVADIMEVLHRWGFIELTRKLNEQTIATASESIKAIALHNLGIIHYAQGEYDKAIEKYNESMKIYEKLGDRANIAGILHQLGNIHYRQGEYDKAIKKYNESLKIDEELGNRKGIAYTLGQLGNIHLDKGEYKQAKDKYEECLKISRELNDISSISKALSQLGMIHQAQGEYDKAIEKYNESMKIKKELDDRAGNAVTLHQLGMIHQKKGEYDKAVEKYNKSLKIKEKLGDKLGIARTLHQLGNINFLQGEYDKAIQKYNESMKISEELGDKAGIAGTLHQLGMIHYDKGEYDKATEKYNESMKISEELDDKSGIASTLHQLGIIHQDQGEYDKALENYIIAATIFKQLKSPDLQTVLHYMDKLEEKIGEETFEKYYKEIMDKFSKEEQGDG